VADADRGRIILLNGVSSSGKSTIAVELLALLPTPFFHMAVDSFGAMRSVSRTAELPPVELERVLARTRAGFHRAVAGMAEAGNDVVMDHVFSEPWRLRDCLQLFRPYFVFFVGVQCGVEELERRERARGDRPPGQASGQIAAVHSHRSYDLVCNTENATARECAQQIVSAWVTASRPTAFDRLSAAHSSSDR
jgi:chloramphenicol 3-O phosphotransferase